MKVILYHRHYGLHSPIKEIKIEGNFYDYVKKEKHHMDNYLVDEDKLINSLPDKFFPTTPNKILITVSKGNWSTGLFNVDKFMKWSKYFDSYVIELIEED